MSHSNNLQGLNLLHGYPELQVAEAEAVIFCPYADRAVEAVARIKGRQWMGLLGSR